jgi:hypothetical protein
MKANRYVFPVIIFLILGVTLGVLLYSRWQVSQTRFFDVDEFTHLHWAANMARGEKPYIDFFTFFTPGFYWFLRPLFVIFGRDPMLFLAARVQAYVVFLGILAVSGWVFSMLRSKVYMLLPVVVLAFLPMPYDKFLEIRPDNLSTVFGFLAMAIQMHVLLGKHSKYMVMASGFFYALSMIVLVKSLPFAAMGFLIALVSGELVYFVAGLAIPSLFLLLWMITLGNFSLVWYSLTKLAFEANSIGRIYPMEPHLFFFPNISFYGGWGITAPLITNHLLWIVGCIVGVWRLFTPFVTAGSDKRKVYAELLMAGVFILSVFGYVQFFPLKHSQYLIPIAIGIAFYAADAILLFIKWLYRFDSIVVLLVLLVFGWQLATQTLLVDSKKLPLSNATQIAETKLLLSAIPPSARILDFEGRMLFWRDGYSICCLPFGAFTQYLSRPPESLSAVLEREKVPYIFQGDSNRLSLVSGSDLEYIRKTYAPVAGWGERFWKRIDL